ncbi:bacterioferritin-associated ferredoxin [Agarilytica rhodophyticola]|uniref:bacterioferritin-associated ferredoxin n=1 Tax=Agarilytica rhodophyticola TaxID=1737490 RepID=UPI000B3430AF|nr:bacterioferritin-associated ferredoxin [Agarilytica rhodophyticola]
MYVCLCKGVTDSQIREAVNNGAESMRAVREQLDVSSQCGKCACHVRDLVKDALEGPSTNKSSYYQVA